MDFVLDLLQGAGIAAGIGLELPLAALLVCALARGDTGIDFDGTDFAFLESSGVMAALLAIAAVQFVLRRRGTPAAHWVLTAAVGAVFGAGSMADGDHSVVTGAVVGAACGALGHLAAESLFTRVRARLEADAARMLPIYGAVAALLAAGLSVLFPPLAVLIVVALIWLLLGSRRREGEKYAGLRILR